MSDKIASSSRTIVGDILETDEMVDMFAMSPTSERSSEEFNKQSREFHPESTVIDPSVGFEIASVRNTPESEHDLSCQKENEELDVHYVSENPSPPRLPAKFRRFEYETTWNPDYLEYLKKTTAASKKLPKIPIKKPARIRVYSKVNMEELPTSYNDSFKYTNNCRVRILPEITLARNQKWRVNRLEYNYSKMKPKECEFNCSSKEFVVEKKGRYQVALAKKNADDFKNFMKEFNTETYWASIEYHRSQPEPSMSKSYKAYKEREYAKDLAIADEAEKKEMKPMNNSEDSDTLEYQKYRETMMMRDKKKLLGRKEAGAAPGRIFQKSAAGNAAKHSSDLLTLLSEKSQLNEEAEAIKAKKKKYNDWSDVIANAENYRNSRSGPQSITSSTSFKEDAQLLNWPLIPKQAEKPSEAAVERESSQSSSRAVEVPALESSKNIDVPNNDVTQPAIAFVSNRRRGRPRKHPLPDEVTNDGQPDIVVEESLPLTHSFPRPDLEPFVVSSPSRNRSYSRRDCHKFTTHDNEESILDGVTEPQFAAPQCLDDSDILRGSTRVMSIIRNERELNAEGSESNSVQSIEFDGPTPAKKIRKDASVVNEEAISNKSSRLSIRKIKNKAGIKTRPSRSRRSFISKNNPNPKIIHQRTSALAMDDEQESNSSRNVCVDSDDAVSRTSSFSHTRSRPGHQLAEISSCASSRLGDFDDLAWHFKSLESQQFGDPQPPPEVTIDEEAEPKPDIDSLPIPEPINETSRCSKKRLREAAKEVKREDFEEIEGVEVLNVIVVRPKEEEEEEDNDDVLIVRADYQHPQNLPVPIQENDVPPPKPKYMSQEELTHDYLMNKSIYDQLNGLFTTDPAQFCNQVMCILEDTEETGKTFLISAEVENRRSDYSMDFINYLAKSPKDGGLEDPRLKLYGAYTSELRMKCALPEVLKEGLSPACFFGLLDQVQEVHKNLKKHLPVSSVNHAERELMSTAEGIMIGKFVISTLRMATLSNLFWSTNAHIRRRFELLLRGWHEFLRKGGFLKVLLAMSEQREDLKSVNADFLQFIRKLLAECDNNVSKAAELLEMNESDLALKRAQDCDVTEAELDVAAKDLRGVKTETHYKECIRCKLQTGCDAYFSTDKALRLHGELHGSGECDICFEDCPSKISYLLHITNVHYSMVTDFE